MSEKRLKTSHIFSNMVTRKRCNLQCFAFFVLEHAKLEFTNYNRFVHTILENTGNNQSFLIGRYKLEHCKYQLFGLQRAQHIV